MSSEYSVFTQCSLSVFLFHLQMSYITHDLFCLHNAYYYIKRFKCLIRLSSEYSVFTQCSLSVFLFYFQMSYIAFMMFFTYIVLVEMDPNLPSWQEFYVILFILTMGVDKVREVGTASFQHIVCFQGSSLQGPKGTKEFVFMPITARQDRIPEELSRNSLLFMNSSKGSFNCKSTKDSLSQCLGDIAKR